MANINITYRCNLCCPYCFANEFVNKYNTDITIENFQKAVDFAVSSGPSRIGLIGGEPLVHPLFPDFVNGLINNTKVKGVNLYTNGVFLDKYFDILNNSIIDILVNCNSPQQIGAYAFEKYKSNLEHLFFIKKYGVTLGVNFHDDCHDYSFIVELLQRFNQKGVRISVTVPKFSSSVKETSIAYFRERKNELWELFQALKSIHVMPYYDCNSVPFCIWSIEEQQQLKEWVDSSPEVFTNITAKNSKCEPVIDILPDLQAIRCFGLSDISMVNIADFMNVEDLESYYLTKIDNISTLLCSSNQCCSCYEHKSGKCNAGCIGFKNSKLKDINHYIEESETRKRE